MKSIQGLFDLTKDSNIKDIPEKYQKRCNRKLDYIDKEIIDRLPVFKYPNYDSKEHKKDLEGVIFYHANPSLNSSFLDLSSSSVEKCFKKFAKELKVSIDWKYISKLVKEVDTVILGLKFKYNRPRPKFILQNHSDIYTTIKDSNSPSFPSGHTSIAYFIASILSDSFPSLTGDLELLAELIGQSRIENGVHYPTDVLFGKMLGQLIANELIESKNYKKTNYCKIKKSDSKDFAKSILQNDKYEKSALSLAEYLKRTNEIEGYNISFEESLECAKKALQGYPAEYCSSNSHLISTISMLVAAKKLAEVNSMLKLINIHGCMSDSVLENSEPGEIRNFYHTSPSGYEYTEPDKIYEKLSNFCNTSYDDYFEKHATFELIHPFSDGNGRLGRTILCSDLDFDFKKVNNLIDKNYIQKINMYFSKLTE